jgi:phosphoribosyl-ATP pyrophosphohydrolase/phosphoribosyl-AMP cyclohydrolase
MKLSLPDMGAELGVQSCGAVRITPPEIVACDPVGPVIGTLRRRRSQGGIAVTGCMHAVDEGGVAAEVRRLASQADWAKGTQCADQLLLPAVVQDTHSGEVLMLGYVSEGSVAESARLGEVVFFSRSRQKLWRKGETSGHVFRLRAAALDCDNDSFLFLVERQGPACHRGLRTCFLHADGTQPAGFPPSASTLLELSAAIAERARGGDPDSYSFQLLQSGLDRVLKKVGEEATEFVIAAKNGPEADRAAVTGEAADLLFHLLLSLEALGIQLPEIIDVLRGRAGSIRRDGSLPAVLKDKS